MARAVDLLFRNFVIAIVGFVVLSVLAGLFPRLFFVFYTGAAALGLLGIAFFILPAGIVGAGAFRRGLLLLFLSPAMFVFGLLMQGLYGAMRRGFNGGALPDVLIDAVTAVQVLGVPLGAWILLGVVAVNVVGLGRGLSARKLIALNIWTVAAGLFAAYVLSS